VNVGGRWGVTGRRGRFFLSLDSKGEIGKRVDRVMRLMNDNKVYENRSTGIHKRSLVYRTLSKSQDILPF